MRSAIANRRLMMLRAFLAAFVALIFSAVPARAQSNPFFFVQLSDPQFGMYAADREFVQETANFEFAIAAVNRLKPAFVVITGDLVNKPGDPAQIAEYERIREKVSPAIPVYDMPGNHDVENAPTPESVAAYRARARDYYVFGSAAFIGIVLDSTLIHTPDKAPKEASDQLDWLRAELTRARTNVARRIVVFQHHPWFLKAADEPDQYFNIPLVRRTPLLQLLRESGVRLLVSGHLHQNAGATVDGLEMVVTAPVGMPLGDARSGLRVFLVTDAGVTHKFYDLGKLPASIDAASGKLP